MHASPLDHYWTRSAHALMSQLHTHTSGLTARAATLRLRRHGRNALPDAERTRTLRLLVRQFESPLVLLLVFAAAIAAIMRDWTDTIIVLAIVLGSALLGFVQEHRASRALEQLRARVRIVSNVLRNGTPLAVPAEEVVPGDIVVLAAGSLIPADGVVIETKDFFVNQAALTGESLPVEKHVGVHAIDASLAERTNCVFMGTSVRSGTARALVVNTGARTVYGALAERLRVRPEETDFARGLRHYGIFLTKIMVVLVLGVFTANVLLERPTVDALLFAVALAVGLSPELLPAIVTITLARGARDMAAHGVIVRRLDAIEDFGSMDVLCTDKTGTLTAGVMALDGALDADGTPSPTVLSDAYINAALQTGLPNPLDEAIVSAGRAASLSITAYRIVDEVPYDFSRKRLSVVVQAGDDVTTRVMITKGALANTLEVCDHLRRGDERVLLDATERVRIEALFTQWSASGARVLGIATKAVEPQHAYGRDDEQGLDFVGFLLFLDPPKAGVATTLAELARLGVRVKIITGDNRLVAAHIAQAVGLDPTRSITGAQLRTISQEALRSVAEENDLFVEVDPNQKEQIIVALKHAGHVVGYLGDGINDASALHHADVGISVDSAVDVAKDAADFVLLEHDLDVLRRGIIEGRVTFANTLKYISITTSANFGNMISMAIASFFLPFLPLLAKQILLNNFLSDFPSMAIASDAVDPEMIERPRRWNIHEVRAFMLRFGLVSSIFDLLTFVILLYVFTAPPELFRTAWFVESLLTELAIVFVVRTRRAFYRSRPGRILLIATLATSIVTLALPYSPMAPYFEFVPLSAALVGTLIAITLGYVIASETVKRLQ